MKVYRYLCEDELVKILNESQDVGSYFPAKTSESPNNFNYKNAKYIHFYKNANAMLEAQKMYRKVPKTFYFCEFNIPYHVLMFHAGKGIYAPHGYQDNYTCEKEFAILAEKFKPSWLARFVKDVNRNQILPPEYAQTQQDPALDA